MRRLILMMLVSCVAACADGETRPTTAVQIAMAPLTLADVTEARWTIVVRNAATQVVVSRAGVASTQYGNGAGDLSYVAPCDATSNPNTVTLTLEAIEVGGVAVPASEWVSPGPITQSFGCVANADVAVAFDVTIARSASQGFFDVGVTFDDVFCSAAFDCGATDDLMLLHDP